MAKIHYLLQKVMGNWTLLLHILSKVMIPCNNTKVMALTSILKLTTLRKKGWIFRSLFSMFLLTRRDCYLWETKLQFLFMDYINMLKKQP